MADGHITTFVRDLPAAHCSDGLVMLEMGGCHLALTRHAALGLQKALARAVAEYVAVSATAEIIPLRAHQ